MPNPLNYESTQEYLEAEGFTLNADFFVKDDVKFPVAEIIGHTPNTFAQKARGHGWVAWKEDEAVVDTLEAFFSEENVPPWYYSDRARASNEAVSSSPLSQIDERMPFQRSSDGITWTDIAPMFSDEGIADEEEKQEESSSLNELLTYWGYKIPPGAIVTRIYKDGKEIVGWVSDGPRLKPVYSDNDSPLARLWYDEKEK